MFSCLDELPNKINRYYRENMRLVMRAWQCPMDFHVRLELDPLPSMSLVRFGKLAGEDIVQALLRALLIPWIRKCKWKIQHASLYGWSRHSKLLGFPLILGPGSLFPLPQFIHILLIFFSLPSIPVAPGLIPQLSMAPLPASSLHLHLRCSVPGIPACRAPGRPH